MTKHKPDCPMRPNWTGETLVRGLKTCTCGADKPTTPAPTEAELALVREWAMGRCCTCYNGDRFNEDGTDACEDCPGEYDPKNWTPAWGKGE